MTNIKSSLVKEMLTSGVIDIQNGELIAWDMPCILYPVNSVLLINIMKKRYPEMTMDELNYQIGKMQSHRGNRVLVQRFGFKANQKLMQEAFGKSEILGMGVFEFLSFDLENKVFVINNKCNSYAKQYLKVFGKQKEPVCHYLRGLCAGSFQAFFEDEEIVCIETSCIAKGDKECLFTIKPLSKWNVKDPLVKKQLIKHRLPLEVFNNYYSWDNLVSPDTGKPKKK